MRIVVLLHGIRTEAAWTSTARRVMEAHGFDRVIPFRYGYFDALRFLVGLYRGVPVRRVVRMLLNLRADFPESEISVVAHSFGTYLITRALREHRYIRIARLILCGSVVPEDFPWDEVRGQLSLPVLNECGTRDIWPVVASFATIGFGATGMFGFGDPYVCDRFHNVGHGGFFTERFIQEFWVPFLDRGVADTATGDADRHERIGLLAFLSSRLARHAFLAAVAAFVLAFASQVSATTRSDPLGRLLYRLGVRRSLPAPTGWIFLGYFGQTEQDIKTNRPNHWVEGPHFRFLTELLAPNAPPQVGDKIIVTWGRRVMIHGWKTEKAAGQLELICQGYDDDKDDTGIRLPPDTEVIVREAPNNCRFSDRPPAIWVRVGYP